MLRNIIESSKVVEVYKIGSDANRGQLLTKDLATKVADKSTGEGVDVFILDYDSQPTGHLADSEVSAYDPTMDVIKANKEAILVSYPVGAQFATDQVDGTFAEGDYAVSASGKFKKAVSTDVSKFQFVGEYLDGSVKLQQFQVVEPHTVA